MSVCEHSQPAAASVQPALHAYKPDAPEAFARMTDWWAGKQVDRAVAAVTAPRQGARVGETRGDVRERLLDADTILHNLAQEMGSTFYGGEAFPAYWVLPIAVPVGVYLGCDVTFADNTAWQHPCFATWGEGEDLAFDPEHPWWIRVKDLTRTLVERGGGRFLVSACGISGLVDVMANLWGSETILLAMATDPDGFQRRLKRLVSCFGPMYDTLYDLVAPRQHGYFDWLRLWAPGRVCTLQNDLSCMVSDDMFEALCLPEIQAQAEHVTYAFYHLDGPGAIRHVEALLRLEALDGIQWVPGAGASTNPMDWLALLKQIQAAGKRLCLAVAPRYVAPLLRVVDRQRVFLQVRCRDTEEAAGVLQVLDQVGA